VTRRQQLRLRSAYDGRIARNAARNAIQHAQGEHARAVADHYDDLPHIPHTHAEAARANPSVVGLHTPGSTRASAAGQFSATWTAAGSATGPESCHQGSQPLVPARCATLHA
jgi:hypothetical protein